MEFASLLYYDDARIRYYYQLEGVDAGWVAAGVNRFAPYTDVAGGNYLFKVKAVRDNGRAASPVTTFAIRVAQPFWKTGWFAGLVGLALAGGAYGLYRVRINRLLALQRVRSRIARDLHDDMGSTLSTINILAAMARQQAAANPPKTEGYLEKISTYSQSLMETMDDIVWSVNPVNDTGQNLVARMREFGREILEPKDIAFSLHTDGLPAAVHLPIEIRYDCFLVFKEALNNAAKYARCRRVAVTLRSAGKGLRVDIQDDGIGFDPSQVREGNGLTNMQKRVAHLRGDWQLHAEPGRGTRVTFTVPLP
ncbi:MAG: ATP-binding protein [Cytophagales bacterium]|nr:ATP-binding protein [Cytophagales bacterium]